MNHILGSERVKTESRVTATGETSRTLPKASDISNEDLERIFFPEKHQASLHTSPRSLKKRTGVRHV